MINAWAEGMWLWSWQSALLILIAAFTVRLHRRSSAAVRHSCWLLGLGAVALLPLANIAVQALPARTIVAPISFVTELPASIESVTVQTAHGPSWTSIIPTALFAVWVCGVLLSAGRISREYIRLRRNRSEWQIEASEFPIRVVYSSAVSAPVLAGFLEPRVLLPENIGAWTNPDERRAVLLHEFAHLSRRDHWVSLFSAILGSVFFFHPAIRLALKQLNLERELACDERVLVAGVRPAVYAEVILKVAEHAVSGQPSDCPAMNASRESLERRLNMILNHRPERVKNVWQLSVALRGAVVAAFAVMVLPQGTITAEMAIPTPIHPAAVIAPIPVPTPEVSAMPVQAAAPPAAAQSTTSQLSGTVYDQSGAVVPGVLITLTPSEGAAQTAITHEGGAYVFKSVGPGKYSLQARLPGFKTMQRDVQVSAGRQERADILLYIGALDTNVVVTATRPSPASASATPIRVGGDISAPNLISSPKPTYPPLARLAGIQGMVKLIGVIRTDGTVGSLSPESSAGGNPELIQAAMDAVKQWRYRPAMLNGVPIEVSTTIQVEFSLTD